MIAMQVNNHTMVLEWREREHEEDNAAVENHPQTIAALRDCGLLKYFRIPGMRAQVRLLEHLVRDVGSVPAGFQCWYSHIND
jgi:hypothetical protein